MYALIVDTPIVELTFISGPLRLIVDAVNVNVCEGSMMEVIGTMLEICSVYVLKSINELRLASIDEIMDEMSATA